jgi:predicted dehydrogenase
MGSLNIACDLSLESAKKLASKFPGCIATDKLEDVLNSDINVAFVCVSNNQLAPISNSLLWAKKHVLIEKPGAISTHELFQLNIASKINNVLVRIGYNHRYHPACLKAIELFKSSDFGDVMFVRGRYGHGGRIGYDKEWRSDKSISGGGELIDQGVHLIDLASIFLGEFETISGHVHTYFWNMSVDDNAFLSLENKNKNVAWLHVSCTEWKNTFSFEIYGKNAKLHWEGLGGSYGVERLTYYKMLPKMGPPETTIFEYPMGDDSWNLEIKEFFEDIRLNRTPIPGIKEAKNVLDVVESIYNRKEL